MELFRKTYKIGEKTYPLHLVTKDENLYFKAKDLAKIFHSKNIVSKVDKNNQILWGDFEGPTCLELTNWDPKTVFITTKGLGFLLTIRKTKFVIDFKQWIIDSLAVIEDTLYISRRDLCDREKINRLQEQVKQLELSTVHKRELLELKQEFAHQSMKLFYKHHKEQKALEDEITQRLVYIPRIERTSCVQIFRDIQNPNIFYVECVLKHLAKKSSKNDKNVYEKIFFILTKTRKGVIYDEIKNNLENLKLEYVLFGTYLKITNPPDDISVIFNSLNQFKI